MTTYAELKSQSKEGLEFWFESSKQDFMISVHSVMLKSKISKSDLSSKIGCSPAYISKVLRGDVNFTIETMVKISRALDTKLCIHLSDPNESIQWMGLVTSKPRPEITQVSRNQWAAAHANSFRKTKVAAHG